jgi:hypothetical protein
MLFTSVLAVISAVGVSAIPAPQVSQLPGQLSGQGAPRQPFQLPSSATIFQILKNLPGAFKPLAEVPNLEKYLDYYLDWRNSSTAPFIGPVTNGPAPKGCSKYEMIIGEFFFESLLVPSIPVADFMVLRSSRNGRGR